MYFFKLYRGIRFNYITNYNINKWKCEIGELKKGLEAEITLPADETKTYTGRITLIGLIFSILNKSDSVFFDWRILEILL